MTSARAELDMDNIIDEEFYDWWEMTLDEMGPVAKKNFLDQVDLAVQSENLARLAFRAGYKVSDYPDDDDDDDDFGYLEDN